MQIHINSFKHKEIFVLPTTFSFYQPLVCFINHFFVLSTTFRFTNHVFVLSITFSFYQPRFRFINHVFLFLFLWSSKLGNDQSERFLDTCTLIMLTVPVVDCIWSWLRRVYRELRVVGYIYLKLISAY